MPGDNVLIQPDPNSSIRRNMAQSLQQQSMSTAPVGHWTQALAKLMQGYVGGKINEDVAAGEKTRAAGAQQTLTEALAGYRGDVTGDFPVEAPGPVQPGMPPPAEMQQMTIPGQGQNVNELVRVLAGNPDTANMANTMMLNQVSAGMKPETGLKQIYDPNSPTGTKWVRPSAAVGQPGKMPSGLDIEFGPDGRPIRISQGRGKGGKGGFTRGTETKIQGKQIDAQESMARLDNIKALFEPRFQKIGTRMGMKWTSLKAKFDVGEISPESMQDLYDYSLYKATSFEHMNKLLNELSGAAVSPQEFKRLGNQLPKAGEGIFDGDDPITFQAKMDSSMMNIKRALMRYKYMSRLGKDALSMPLWKIDDVINTRGKQLEAQFEGDPNADELIRQALKQEFMM